MNLGNLMETIKDEVSIALHEADKFSAGNKSAGTRVRKHMQNIKGIAQNNKGSLTAPFFFIQIFVYFLVLVYLVFSKFLYLFHLDLHI